MKPRWRAPWHVELGGPSTYGRLIRFKPTLGDPGEPIGPAIVRRAVGVMWVASGIAVFLAWIARAYIVA